MLNFQLSSGPRLLQLLKGDFPRKHRPNWTLWKWPSPAADFRGGMNTWQAPAPAQRLPTMATWEWRPGLHPQPTTAKYPTAQPGSWHSQEQLPGIFPTGAQTKQIALSGLDSTAGPYIHHKPPSSKLLNVLRHQTCPILIPKWLQLRTKPPPVPSVQDTANEPTLS